MKGISMSVVLTLLGLASALHTKDPPHCTTLSKSTDYKGNYHFTYQPFYLADGQKEAYQQLRCINPATVSEAVTKVCDWAAPPLVQFTLGDGYVFVQRRDPSNRFAGTAVITTTQECNHNIPQYETNYTSVPTVIQMR